METVRKIRTGHPRIFLTPERVPELRSQALTGKGHIFNLLKQRTGPSQAAVFYALGDGKGLGLPKSREEYGRMAAEALTKAISANDRRATPDSLATLYDWAYGALTWDEKKNFVKFCKARLGSRVRVHNDKQHGYRTSPAPEGILAALAFYGDGIDDAYAEQLLLQGIRDTLLDNLAMEHVAGTDGGFADGTYYIFQLGGTFNAFLAIGIATDTNFFFEHEVMAKLPNHLMQALIPFPVGRAGGKDLFRYFATFHDNWTSTTREYGSVGQSLANRFAITAAEYQRKGNVEKAGLYMWFLKEAFGGIPYQAQSADSFVLMDWSIKPRSPKDLDLPLSEALGWDEEKGEIDRDRFGKKAGIGWVSMRSAWDDADATYAIFKAEPFYYHGHMHRDSLAFMIAKGEELALARAGNYQSWFEGNQIGRPNAGWPQMANFFSRTISTNNLLVYNPAEKFDDDWKNVWANDGGQRLTEGWDRKWGREYNGTANGNYRDIGGLTQFERSAKFVYAAADATRAYNSTFVTTRGNPPKVNLVQREFVYLRSPKGEEDYFVIFDRVEAVKPEFRKIWLLQLRARPEFDGTFRVAVGNENGGIHLSHDSSLFHVKQERAELWGKTLLPKDGNRVMRRLGGWITTTLKQPLGAKEDGPLDIDVESTEGMPEHPVVIITARGTDPEKEIFDKFSVWPRAIHASINLTGDRICYFCEGRTPVGKKPAKLLKCVRATKASPGVSIPAGARVIQEFRHMGVEGVDREMDSERIDYPWGYGLSYNYGDSNQYGLWRLEVSPKKASKYDNFLHVLHPALRGRGKLEASLIETESGSLYGAQIGNKAVIFSRTPEPQAKGAYTISGPGETWQLLCNLKPGSRYQVKKDGSPVTTSQATKQGTLEFTSVISGKSSRFDFSILN